MKVRTLATFALAFAAALTAIPLAAQSAEKPRLAVFGFLNQTGDDTFTIPAETASSNLLITMRMLNLFQVSEPETIPRSLTDSSLEQWCTKNDADFVIFGTLTKKPDETQEYQIAYFSRAAKTVTDRKNATGQSVLDVFSVIDTLVDRLLGTITQNKISFGSLQFANAGISDDYDVYLDAVFIQTNPSKFDRVPSGDHTVRIVQKATGKEVVNAKTTIAQGKTVTVKFELKAPTEAERVIIVTKEVPAAPAPVAAPIPEPAVNGTYQEGITDGTAKAKGLSAMYFMSGCCLGAIGIVIPAVSEPEVPGDMVLGKSSEYIQGFREGYKSTKKSNNVKSAVIGLGTSAVVGCVSYVALLAYLSSIATAATTY